MLHLTPENARTMPWKNGGGSTTELLIRPEGLALSERFLFRVSIADVASSGPFSSFPGVDRHLVVIAGAGMTLTLDGRTVPLELHRPVFFSGDAAAAGTLLDGPVRDFNLMVDRARAASSLSCVLATAPLALACASGETVIVHVLSGALDEAAAGDTLVLDAPQVVHPRGEARLLIGRVVTANRA
ncbi:MAG: HutD family protein [Archangium sp.]|nr:HutD family protein [Archangium sp.]